MKRLRYTLWALLKCIELELKPLPCNVELPGATECDKDCGCGWQYCEWPAGHPGLHRNIGGIQWQ